MSEKQKDLVDRYFYHVSRSHLYWGRRPARWLGRILKDLGPGDIFLDPFCGGGTPSITALSRGARVIAGELNPMAVFISRVLIQPISFFAINEAFEAVRDDVAGRILEHYAIACPKCRKAVYFDYLKWENRDSRDRPTAVILNCRYCGLNGLTPLSEEEIETQLQLAAKQPEFWFPRDPIRSQKKTRAKFFHELFTGRNLTSLAALHHAIETVSSIRCRETLHFVFTGMLYSCSSLQMFSDKAPYSSCGWTKPGFFMPAVRQEKNVWKAFETHFRTVLNCKKKTNAILGSVQISNSMEEFENSDDHAYLYEADYSGFSFPKELKVTHVFLDPPYDDDIDYIGFSEFWGCWLGMASDIQTDWHPGITSVQENAKRLLQLLLRIRDNTDSSCIVSLAYGAKKRKACELMREGISAAGYRTMEQAPMFWDNSLKSSRNPSNDLYLLLHRESRKTKRTDDGMTGKDSLELKFLVRVTAFLLPDITNPEGIIDQSVNLISPQLRQALRDIQRPQVKEWISNRELNRKAYNRLSLFFVDFILSQDGYRVVSVDLSQFDDSHMDGYGKIDFISRPPNGVDFVMENDKGRKIFFCFYDDQREDVLRRISKGIFKEDNDQFQKICCLILPTQEVLMRCRQVQWADNWPRGFFMDFNRLLKKAKGIDQTRFGHLEMTSPKSESDFRSRLKIDHFTALVTKNEPVGGNGDPKHFIIRFKAPELKYVVPGQFVMIDTLPTAKRRRAYTRHSHSDDRADLTPVSFLKRPFSIHRAFYKNFELDYLKTLSLPPALASITQTVFPDEFEIFCKLVENGVGTNELRQIAEGSTFRILGPLGKRTNLSKWRSNGIKEVHLIGGGVGMAPLMFFAQALKYYSFKIKAFIGIDRFETLLYKPPGPSSFTEHRQKAYVYIDNLMGLGLNQRDIHLSYEEKTSTNETWPGLSRINYYNGLVSRQYESYIKKLNSTRNILALACGPGPMLKALANITSKFRMPMKILMEKRMGCGIGVCMSCVCRTKNNNEEQYSRVCMEGPLFDSEEIVWE